METIQKTKLLTESLSEKGLENAIYQAFGTARDISPDDIKALSINNEFGKDEPTSAMAYRLLFESMTGIDVEGISKRLKDMDKIEYAPVQNMVLESVKEASTAFFVDKSSKKLLAADRTSDKVAKELKALFDVAGMKVKDEQMVIPEQRAGLYKQVMGPLMDRYGTEFLPTYSK